MVIKLHSNYDYWDWKEQEYTIDVKYIKRMHCVNYAVGLTP